MLCIGPFYYQVGDPKTLEFKTNMLGICPYFKQEEQQYVVCRTRLQRHNARRRKQKPDSSSQGPTGSGTMDVDQSLGADDAASSKKKRTNRAAAPRDLLPEVRAWGK